MMEGLFVVIIVSGIGVVKVVYCLVGSIWFVEV